MKYFTKEIWAGWQTRNSEKWFKKYGVNLKYYWRQLKNLKGRLGSKLYRFLTRVSLHDGRMLSFNVRANSRRRQADLICVEILVRQYATPRRRSKRNPRKMINLPVPKPYLLRYENVRKIEFNYPSQAPLFYNPGWDIGDWGYDEVTAADKNFLRHDILFSSGATILLEFEKLRVTYPH